MYPKFERRDANDWIHYYSSFVRDDEFWQFSFIKNELLQFVKVRVNPSESYINRTINNLVNKYGNDYTRGNGIFLWEEVGVALIYEEYEDYDLLRINYFDDSVFDPLN